MPMHWTAAGMCVSGLSSMNHASVQPLPIGMSVARTRWPSGVATVQRLVGRMSAGMSPRAS
jgi:hypothetical protein